MEATGDGFAWTNNICEKWHHGLQSLLQCNHPTIWRFIDCIRSDCCQQKALFLQGVTGIEQPGVKKYRILIERVKRSVAAYGQTDILTYLSAVAHFSFN